MGNLIKEELNKMKYLFEYKRGVIISEQVELPEDDDPFEGNAYAKFDWRGKQKGLINFGGSGPLATNVGYAKGRYSLGVISEIPRLIGKGSEKPVERTPEKQTIPVLSELNLLGSAFPYPDNMVQPKFESFPEAKKVYDAFIQSIVDFLKVAHMSQMGTLTIQGTADAARPTYDIPKGYTKLDHPGDLYNGLETPNEMNQYLADTRATELGKLIVQDVLNKTGINISKNITYKKGINYYGQKDKRGFDFKKVTVTPSQTTVTITKPDVVTTDQDAAKMKVTSSEPPKPVQQYLDLSEWGSQMIPATRIQDGSIGINYETVKDMGLFKPDGKGILGHYQTKLNNKSEVQGEIKGNTFFVDGMSFGDIVPASSDDRTYNTNAESSTKFVTSKRPVIVGTKGDLVFIKFLSFAFQSFK